MTITLSVVNTTQQQSIQSTSNNLLATIANITTNTTSNDVANVSTASQLQSQTNGLKQLAKNLAQASSLTQTAQNGVSQIASDLTQLQSIATQAENTNLNSDQLNQQFQQLVNQVDQTANSTSFNGQSLLNGGLAGSNALSLDNIISPGSNSNGDPTLSINSLTSSSLFGGQSLDVLTNADATQALSTINNAIGQVSQTKANIDSFQQAVNYSSANVETAITNQQAAQSSFTDASTGADIQQNVSTALAAQGNRLTPNILQLIG